MTTQLLPDFLFRDCKLQVQPEDVKELRKMTHGTQQVLLKWKGLPECDNTWKDKNIIATQFLDFPLDDKVELLGGGDDGPNTRVDHVYQRKRPTNSMKEQQHKGENAKTDHNVGPKPKDKRTEVVI